jgi:hypothetical protein
MKGIIVSLKHNVQRRHPEKPSVLSETRTRFLASLEKLIYTEGIQLVAEEAGDDKEVAEKLQQDDDSKPEREMRNLIFTE